MLGYTVTRVQAFLAAGSEPLDGETLASLQALLMAPVTTYDSALLVNVLAFPSSSAVMGGSGSSKFLGGYDIPHRVCALTFMVGVTRSYCTCFPFPRGGPLPMPLRV